MSEDAPDLEALDALVRQALVRVDESDIHVLGYGEIASVVGWPVDAPRWACKRLPPFRDRDQFDRYAATVVTYIEQLGAAGVHVVPSRVEALETPHGLVGYIVQPVLDGERLGPRYLRDLGDDEAVAVVGRVVDHIMGAVTPRLGLDAQLSNWVVGEGGELTYLDLTTPMLRDEEGRDQLDAALFLASLPWALRGIVYRFVLKSVLDKYFDPRGIIVDLLANLHKERLADRLPALLSAVNPRLEKATDEAELRKYYKSDARMWAFLQRLRRADRWWQRKVRRRVYPFLLPGKIER